ncbi:hypothetical protein L6R29_08075 [Myxococcota bacterium]|nr:hypothetical protein [Myxococcota bacterium]
MSTPESSRSRWSLLAIPPTTTEEVAIVPCDGCDKNPQIGRIVQALAQRQSPHLACIYSIPPLIFHKGPGTQHRYECAQARVSVAGCKDNCPKKLLAHVAPVEREVILAPDAPFESQLRSLEDAVVSYSALIPQVPHTPAFLPPAAFSPKRRRFVDLPSLPEQRHLLLPAPSSARAASVASAPASTTAPVSVAVTTTPSADPRSATTPRNDVFPPNPAPSVSVARFSGPQTGLFQDQAVKARKKTRYMGLFIVFLLTAAIWWRFASPFPIPFSSTTSKHPPLSRLSLGTKPPEPPRPSALRPSDASSTQKPSTIGPEATSARPLHASATVAQKPNTTPPEKKPLTDVASSVVQPPTSDRPTSNPPTPPKPPASPKPSPVDAAHLLRSQMVNQGWIGGLCTSQQSCGYTKPMCLPVPKGGYCTRYCLAWCPRSTNPWHAPSSCIRAEALAPYVDPLPITKGGLCMTQCDFRLFPKQGCRVGTTCIEVPLHRKNKQPQRVCVPTPHSPPKDSP